MGVESPGLSLCMIVRDEESFLPGSLAAAAPLVDEIVIVDTGSTDRTPRIAAAAGARLLEDPWRDDFSRARNLALDAARGLWILVLDADERLLPCSRTLLDRAIQSPKNEALTVEIRSELAGGGLQSTHIVRLFKNRPEYRYRGRIHEQIAPAIAAHLGLPHIRPPRSPLVALHSGYRPDQRAARQKAARNERLLRAAVSEHPDDPSLRFLLARELTREAEGELLRLPRNEEALALLEAALPHHDRPLLAHEQDASVRLARLCILYRRFEQAAGILDRLGPAVGGYLPAAFARAELLAGKQEFPRAIHAFQACMEISADSTPLGDVDPRLGGVWAWERIGHALLELGQPEKARKAAEKALDLGSSLAGPRLLLARIEAASNSIPSALRTLLEAARLSPQDPRPHLHLATLLHQAGKNAAARQSTRTALKTAPRWVDALEFLSRLGEP